MTKEQLRKQFLETRKNFDLDSLQENSQAISQNFFNYIDLSDIQKLHVFLPF